MFKILVVEDDSATRLFFKKILQKEGYDVAIAKNGEEGLLQSQVLHPALIICDWIMPAMDGLELCQKVKSDPNLTLTFFILLTSQESVEHRVEGLDAGADEFLSKPVAPNELLARVRAGLRQYQLTQELRAANQQLSQTLTELQQTQMQLIQSAKMSSLGQMVAGIAHELNNPVTFIDGNLLHASHYIEDLLNLVQLYQKHYPNPADEIQEQMEFIDLAFLKTDLPNLLSSIKTGAKRISQIVLSLRNFSRLDEVGKKRVNLHEGLDNTLLMLQHRLQAPDGSALIQVIKDYGNLPLIECYPGQLNQVFLSIISNAIDVLEMKNKYREVLKIKPSESLPNYTQFSAATIRIATEILDNQRVMIRISDNGPGIAPEVQQKLFDPFFTTKSVGKGTGMSLSISYKIIVEKHNGRLSCISQPGQGAEFIIELPLQQVKTIPDH